MRIIVPVKRVVDPYVSIRVKPDQTGVEINNVKMSMNPFDEIALEQAIRLKEQGAAESVTVVSVGPEKAQETLRAGLALGADDAVLVKTDQALEPINIAKILNKIVRDGDYKLVLMGKQSIDGDNNQTPQYLAEFLGWPQATYASAVKLEGEALTVTREIDGGLETIALNVPAVVSADLRLNEPRYATLPNIMKAKKKPLTIHSLEELGIEIKQHLKVIKVESPPERKAGRMVKSIEDLVEALKNEAKVI